MHITRFVFIFSFILSVHASSLKDMLDSRDFKRLGISYNHKQDCFVQGNTVLTLRSNTLSKIKDKKIKSSLIESLRVQASMMRITAEARGQGLMTHDEFFRKHENGLDQGFKAGLIAEMILDANAQLNRKLPKSFKKAYFDHAKTSSKCLDTAFSSKSYPVYYETDEKVKKVYNFFKKKQKLNRRVIEVKNKMTEDKKKLALFAIKPDGNCSYYVSGFANRKAYAKYLVKHRKNTYAFDTIKNNLIYPALETQERKSDVDQWYEMGEKMGVFVTTTFKQDILQNKIDQFNSIRPSLTRTLNKKKSDLTSRVIEDGTKLRISIDDLEVFKAACKKHSKLGDLQKFRKVQSANKAKRELKKNEFNKAIDNKMLEKALTSILSKSGWAIATQNARLRYNIEGKNYIKLDGNLKSGSSEYSFFKETNATDDKHTLYIARSDDDQHFTALADTDDWWDLVLRTIHENQFNLAKTQRQYNQYIKSWHPKLNKR